MYSDKQFMEMVEELFEYLWSERGFVTFIGSWRSRSEQAFAMHSWSFVLNRHMFALVKTEDCRAYPRRGWLPIHCGFMAYHEEYDLSTLEMRSFNRLAHNEMCRALDRFNIQYEWGEHLTRVVVNPRANRKAA